MIHTLISSFILEAYTRRQFEGHFEAACLSLDMMGFTAFTEALVAHGQAGSEALAAAMSALFEPLVLSVHAHGGFITHFAGDGFTALFPGTEAQTNRRALAAGWAIRQHVRAHPVCETPYGSFPRSARIGIACGDIAWGILPAGEGAPHAWYFSGEALTDCTRMQQQAAPGEVVVSANMAAALASWIVAETLPAGAAAHVLDLTLAQGEQPSAPAPGDPAAWAVAARRFLPPALDQLNNRGEFRNAVAVFLSVQQVQRREDLVSLMTVIFDLQRRYGGYLSSIEWSSSECRLFLFWGAPVAHEGDVEQALHFVAALPARLTQPLRAGMTYRVTYAGLVGAAQRADYVCYGQGTNLAARMAAAAAWGDIWLDEAIARRAAAFSRQAPIPFSVEQAGARPFKGFAAPQPVYALRSRPTLAAPARFAGPLIGRQAELVQLTAALELLCAGQPAGLITLLGEAGIGKTRLLHELRQQLTAASWFTCPADEIRRYSLEPFRQLLRVRFEQAIAGDAPTRAANTSRFVAKLDALSAATSDPALQADLAVGRPFLAALADLPWSDPRYAQMEPKARFDNTLSALRAFLLAESRRQPLVLVIEDAHWLDADSRQFLRMLSHNLGDAPLAILLVSRVGLDLEGFNAALPRHELRLARLAAADMARLAQEHLGAPPAPALLALLQARSEGNPFFTEQLLRHLREQNLLTASQDGLTPVAGATSLPTDARGVLIARVDGLTRPVREAVQAAAVLGRQFERAVLAELAPADGPLDAVLAAAVEAGMWASVDGTRFQFQHALLHEAVYDMQLRSRLQKLHGLAAVALERVHATNPAPYYGDLAYHYGQAGDAVQERRCARLAGERAAAQYANTEAVTYLSRALALTPEDAAAERYALLRARLLVYDLQGAREAQRDDLTALTALVERLQDDMKRVEVAVQAARYAYLTGDYKAAAKEAERTITRAGAGSEIATRARLVWGQALSWLGDYPSARVQLTEALIGAQALGLAAVATHCWLNLGIVSYSETDYARAQDEISAALGVSRACGDRRIEGMALGTLGSIAYEQGNYSDAKPLYQQALDICRQIGDRPNQGISLGNLSHIALYQGRYDAARAYAEETLAICREVGNRYGETVAYHALGQIARNLGDHDAARAWYEQALESARATEGKGEEGEALASLGLLRHQNGDNREAERLCREALAVVEALGEQHLRTKALTNLGYALVTLGDLAGAAAVQHEALAARRTAGEKTRVLENLAALGEIALAAGDLAQAQQHIEPILTHLAVAPVDGAEEPLRVYLACVRVLQAGGDPRAYDVLETARGLLHDRATAISDATVRQSYLELPAHRALRQAVSQPA